MPESTVNGDSHSGETPKESPSNASFQFAWTQEIDKFGDKLLKRLDEFRKSSMYDVKLKAGKEEFCAHKIVLAACGGIFRTCFIDHDTKMMSNAMTEMSLDCPPEGIRPILKFAYSGKLEITHRNVFAALLAAEVTEMAEVKEICSYIATNKYGWIINDTEVNKDNTTKLTKILAANEYISEETIDVNNNEDSMSVYEAFVKEHCNDRLATFIKICQRIKSIIPKTPKVKKEGTKKKEEKIEVPEKTTEVEKNIPLGNEKVEEEDEEAKKNEKGEAESESKPEKEDEDVTDVKDVEVKTAKQEEKEAEKEVATSNVTSPPPKPIAVPRKHTPSGDEGSSTDDSAKAEVKEVSINNESAKPRPRTPPKSPPAPRQHPVVKEKVSGGKLRNGSPNRASVKGKKAPEPPKVPPPVVPKVPKKAPPGKTPKKAPPPPTYSPSPKATKTPGKTPPPRPKPPSIKKHPKATPAVNYGDTTNPFADENRKNGTTKETNSKTEDKEYDDSLNPFA